MSHFKFLKTRINESLLNSSYYPSIIGLSPLQYSLYLELTHSLQSSSQTNIFIFSATDEAEEFFDLLENYSPHSNNFFFFGHDSNIYEGYLSSEKSLVERFFTLQKILELKEKKASFNLVTTMEGLHLKIPTEKFINNHKMGIEISDIISPDSLKTELLKRGYSYSITVEEPGTFSHKGEIFDIYPTNRGPIRLIYFDDMIEEIYAIDPSTLKTIREQPLEKVELGISPRTFCQPTFSTTLRSKIPNPGPSQKKKFEFRKKIFSLLSDGNLFENYPIFIPLFCEETATLYDYIPDKESFFHIFNDFKIKNNWEEFLEELKRSSLYTREEPHNECILPEPHLFYEQNKLKNIPQEQKIAINEILIENNIDKDSAFDYIYFKHQEIAQFFDSTAKKNSNRSEYLNNVFKKIKDFFSTSGEIIFFYTHQSALDEFKYLLKIFSLSESINKRISYSTFPLDKGFFYEVEKLLLITEGDLFSAKRTKVQTSIKEKDLDLFAEQIATLEIGDYVIHSDHGVGKYLGLQSLDFSKDKSDFLVIEYSEKDKVYVPVYKMNLIQKHAPSASSLSLDSLRTNKFLTLKKRANQSIKKLAFDLLKLQAERESKKAFSFSPPSHDYNEFELAFKFHETPDQRKAINHVLEDMQKEKAMDRLICGDVGFGKTEIAMRAAYKAVLDSKQVAMLVPTTILALQHFNSFERRFKGFAVNIDFVSRFKTTKEINQILERLNKGEIDIIIGTHKLLNNKIKFRDLGLVIVDEEQRFGVGHKEKLKLLKANVDFLTLTATPIPRTLQLSFLGLRNLSLIKTPPPKRQSIKTYLIKDDALTIQSAILKELKRGGQVFIVHNKVNDIESYASHIKDLVPEASLVIAHGQLKEKELEKRIRSFYDGDYQILIATTIIESGIDIPNANTMIIDRADTYGLGQLHQLRGRIGRSDRKAYAYFIIPNDRSLSQVAEKRLKALQTYTEMGAGFNIASSDLEIRGAGDILGANQSGHIEAIGLELYMNLLQDAIRELKGEKQIINRSVEVLTPFPAYIPNTYIPDSSERLKQYKILSNTYDSHILNQIFEDFIDLYGPPPLELENLRYILNARTFLIKCGIKLLQANSRTINIQFDKEILDGNPQMAKSITALFLANPKSYHFSPDYKVLYHSKKDINREELLIFCQSIAEKIIPC